MRQSRGGNSKDKGPEVEKSLCVFKSLRKTYGIGCRSKTVTGVGIEETGVVWDKLGEVVRALVRTVSWKAL